MGGLEAADEEGVDEEVGREWPTREIQDIARQREFYQVKSYIVCCCCL